MFEAGLVVGVVMLVTAAVIALGDTDRLSKSMPTQALPREVAKFPAGVGLLLVVISAVGLAF